MSTTFSTAVIILANGFEELEAVATIDVLRRAQVQVTVAALDYPVVIGAHELVITADVCLKEVENNLFDMIILPGGEPGTTHLQENERVTTLLKKHSQAKKWIAAICAAPRILDALGLLDGKKATSFPGTKSSMTRCTYLEDAVVQDGFIITARGVGVSLNFALTLVAALRGDLVAKELGQRMLIKKGD